MSTLLSAQSVGYDNSFGPLLAEITFSLKKGDRIGLIGHNGCGKSTNDISNSSPPTAAVHPRKLMDSSSKSGVE